MDSSYIIFNKAQLQILLNVRCGFRLDIIHNSGI